MKKIVSFLVIAAVLISCVAAKENKNAARIGGGVGKKCKIQKM